MEEHAVENFILVVENNTSHAQLIASALQRESTRRHLERVTTGEQALNFLRRRGDYANAPRPHLILLDLNLPECNGTEILAEIKADPSLKRIPIVILTASENETDILRSYELQGNCYVIKATDLDQLFAIIKRIEGFWLGIVTLPTE
ncbi:MAG TPA: response regulator [Allocoleopsis sp.]